MTIVNALSIDVEDYFHVHAFSDVIQREDWDSFEPRVEKNTYRILDLLDSTGLPATRNSQPATCRPIRATFFILGWVAERFPHLVKEIHQRGHEVGCHGYHHEVVFRQTRNAFKNDVRTAKSLLEDITGEEVKGYRAPTYSITKKTLWALEILLSLGFTYDSSIFPINHDVYGFPEAPRFQFLIHFNGNQKIRFKARDDDSETCHDAGQSSRHDSLTEFPMTTCRLLGYNLPVSGGGYFRLLPYRLTRFLLKRVNTFENKPFVFYLHPWEIDPGIPDIHGAGVLSRFRTYNNLPKTEDRLKRLLSDFRFSSLSDILSGESSLCDLCVFA